MLPRIELPPVLLPACLAKGACALSHSLRGPGFETHRCGSQIRRFKSYQRKRVVAQFGVGFDSRSGLVANIFD
jgi:hypothetical protein